MSKLALFKAIKKVEEVGYLQKTEAAIEAMRAFYNAYIEQQEKIGLIELKLKEMEKTNGR